MSLSMGHPPGGTTVLEAGLGNDFPEVGTRRKLGSEHSDSDYELEENEISIHTKRSIIRHPKYLPILQEGQAAGLAHLPGAQEATCHKKKDTTRERAANEDVENGICSSDGRVREPLDPQGTSATGHGHRRLPGKRFSCHPVLSLVLILLLVLVLALAVALAVQSATQTPVPPATTPVVLGCPHGWIGYNGLCYYFSRDYSTWDEAQERCSELGASLAIVKDEAMDLLFRLGGNGDYWVGLRRWGEHLQWGDGSSFSSSVPVLGNSECVYLAEEKFRSVICSNPQPYLCSKPRAPL
ncbi:early activation antigen CD69-like [Oenanthe melanoleuca]|uniref:early activation antigen CD69-like n=1 Tax=Oenanthe melanoleuca TaxID=2939378 RepID=UPI0024C1BDF5|nr:early activation antigen CD69-like [Oenanthe melanoleuca]XP_056351551.1 early activation antigen CD69-like [Oenanthe melanoleuca]